VVRVSIQCLLCENRDAGHRYACHKCETGLQRKLRHLETYASWFLTAEPYRGAPGRGAPGYGSRSPARDDVIAAMDIRSDGDVFGPDDSPTPIVSIPGGLRYLATWVSQMDGSRGSAPKTVRGCVAYLLGRVPHLAMDKKIKTFADQVNILYSQARALAHDQPPKPLGNCMVVDCTGKVFPLQVQRDMDTRGDGARCTTCLRPYSGLDLVRLSVSQETS
jgi:hypothetical protein